LKASAPIRPFSAGLFALGVVLLGGTAASAQSACESLDGQRCLEKLTTGIDMSYLETGPRDGTPVILIHGLTDNVRSWWPTMMSLHKRNPKLHIMAVDLRVHGRSTMPDEVTCAPAPEACFRPADFAADIVAFMQTKGIDKAALVGHSLGSFVIQEVALTHPERVSHAILDATAASSVGNVALRDYVLKEPIEGSWKTALQAAGKAFPAEVYTLTPKDADPKVDAWLSANWVVDPTADSGFLSPYVPETASVKLGTWIGATKALLAQDNSKRLEHLAVPTLVMWGTQDSIFLAADQDAIKKALTVAAKKNGQPVFWKQYGAIPLPASGFQESDIGHNVQWAAFNAVAIDIDAFIATGAPTLDLVHSAPAADIRDLVVERGKAVVVQLGKSSVAR
jgi:pimeloyl-ACP methyl ester carboxylesterase